MSDDAACDNAAIASTALGVQGMRPPLQLLQQVYRNVEKLGTTPLRRAGGT